MRENKVYATISSDLCVFCDRIIKQRDFPAYKLVLNNMQPRLMKRRNSRRWKRIKKPDPKMFFRSSAEGLVFPPSTESK